MATITNLDTANPATAGGRFLTSIASFTRVADTTAYASGDIVSDTVAGGTPHCIEFPGAGKSGAILGASLSYAETDTVNFELWLFDSEPTNFFDNVALALVAADIPKIVARINFLDTNKTTVGTNLNYYVPTVVAVPGWNRHTYATTDGKLYGLLVTRSIFTPISAAKVTIRLELEQP